MIFNEKRAILWDTHRQMMIGEARWYEGLFMIEGSPVKTYITTDVDSALLWHQRTCHPSNHILKQICPNGIRNTIDISTKCEVCIRGKICRKPFWSCSLWPLGSSTSWWTTKSKKYFVTFVDDKSRCTWIYLIKNKFDVLDSFKQFQSLVLN